MQIRKASEADKQQLKAMFKYGIDCSDSYTDWYFDKCRGYGEALVYEEDGKVVSVVEETTYSLAVNHTAVKAGYISSIFTLPEYRGKGYARELVSDMLVNMRNSGKLVCFAVPPSYRMFDKFGFRLTHQYKQYKITMKNIPAYSIFGSVERIQANEHMIAVLTGIYEKFTADKNGYVLRTPQNWMLIMEDLINNFGGHVALVRDSAGNAVGYLMYIINGREMHIYEMAYMHHSAYASIMAYIRSHNTQIDNVMIKAPANDLSYLDFADNRTAIGLYPFVSARITDVKSALKLAASKGFAGNLSIQVVDRIIEENNGTYVVSQDGVTLADESTTADVMCDVGTLTQLFMGFLSPAEAEKMNLICGDISSLDKLFPKKDNFINMLIV